MKSFLHPSCETRYEDRSGSRRTIDKTSLTPVVEVMNSVIINQVTFNLMKSLELWQQPAVYLSSGDEQSVIQAFPSHPVSKLLKPQGKVPTVQKTEVSDTLLWKEGDILQLALKEPGVSWVFYI